LTDVLGKPPFILFSQSEVQQVVRPGRRCQVQHSEEAVPADDVRSLNELRHELNQVHHLCVPINLTAYGQDHVATVHSLHPIEEEWALLLKPRIPLVYPRDLAIYQAISEHVHRLAINAIDVLSPLVPLLVVSQRRRAFPQATNPGLYVGKAALHHESSGQR
jgi:hypothetical protein